MGIFGALTTAVTGLKAQSFALENISGNIANSQTTAFKRVDTSFQDLIPDNPPSKQLSGTVIANARATNTVQGDFQSASIGTFMAINGDGFFIVQKPASFVDSRPTFDGSNLYTRRGDFQTDKDGFLVNGAGYYLMGIPVDPDDRQPFGQRAAAAAIPERLPAGRADDADRISRQPPDLSAHPGARQRRAGLRADRSGDLCGQPDRRRAGARQDHRLRRDACRPTRPRRSPARRSCPAPW